MSSKQWREFLRKELEEKEKADGLDDDWTPDVSEEGAIREIFWRMKEGDVCYDEFKMAYDEFCRDYDLSIGLDVYRDREKFREINPADPYQEAVNNAWKLIDLDIFKAPQDKARQT